MLKKILTTIILSTLSLNAYEINFTKNFSKQVSPDTLGTKIFIHISKENKKEVSQTLDKFTSFFKSLRDLKLKNGSYSISPEYKYLKNETKFIGYEGSLTYKVEAKTAIQINTFIEDLLSLNSKINSKDVKIEISNIQWEISKELYEKNTEKLRRESILWVNTYAKTLSAELKNTCKVKTININSSARNNIFYDRRSNYSSKMRDISNDISPIKNDENINLNSTITMECK